MKNELTKGQKITMLKAVQSGKITKELKELCNTIANGTTAQKFEFQIVYDKKDLEFYEQYNQYVESLKK